MKTSAIFLVFLNVLTAILSLVVIGGGAYILQNFDEFTNLFGSGSVWIAIAGGAVGFIVSFLGCYGTLKEKTCFLSIYGLVILAVLAATSAGLFFYNDGLEMFDDATSGVDAIEATETTQMEINDRLLATYTFCCSGCVDPICDPVIPVPEEFETLTFTRVEYCSGTDNNFGSCYSRPSGEDPLPLEPPFEISQSVCSALEKLTVNGSDIVGNFTTAGEGSCGGGDPRVFTRSVFDWVDSNTTLIFSGSIGFAVLMGLTLIATMYVACCGSDTD